MSDAIHKGDPIPPDVELIEEYKETLAFMRHDDQIAWTILGLSYTIAFGVWAYSIKDVPFRSGRSVTLTLLGVLVFALGRRLASRVTLRTNWRKERAMQIEQKIGFELLRGAPKKSLGMNRMLTRVTNLATALWCVYFVAYLIFWRPA